MLIKELNQIVFKYLSLVDLLSLYVSISKDIGKDVNKYN